MEICSPISLWEPLTKQFYTKCQCLSDLQSSQSAWSMAAPISVGPRPSSWQHIRDGHPERQAFRANPCGGRSEYFHHSLASHRKRQKADSRSTLSSWGARLSWQELLQVSYLHCGHRAEIRQSSQRQRSCTLITLQNGHFKGLMETFHE